MNTKASRFTIWSWLHEEKERMDSFKEWAIDTGLVAESKTTEEWHQAYCEFRKKAEGGN